MSGAKHGMLWGTGSAKTITGIKLPFGYARVSSIEQNLDRQVDELHKHGAREGNLFTDKMTGATLERLGFDAVQ
ncbi:hypothetical protein YDYSY3_45300 [Paenibacillus chitinolyticus]|nr:hypothetical protein YDYSY3_45300 [Paenibacillus chitinolyticus]